MPGFDTPIDYVIPFVNCNDAEWLREYRKHVPEVSDWSNNSTRFRDWNTLRYQLRSIEKNMPWIRYVYIVMSVSESQVPAWLNRESDRIRLVWDWEIVPQEHLPVFNSNVIDLYIPRIDGLSEHYLYACDDYLVMQPLSPEDFYTESGIKLTIRSYRFRDWTYSHTIVNSVRLICPHEVRKSDGIYILPYSDHAIVPHIKSENLAVLDRYECEVNHSVSQFRESKNLTWLIYPLSLRKKGKLEGSNLRSRYFELRDEESIERLDFNNCDIVVLNDEYNGNFYYGKRLLRQLLDSRFPDKSEFEL